MDPPRSSFLCLCHYLLAFTHRSVSLLFQLCLLPSKTLRQSPFPAASAENQAGDKRATSHRSQPGCLPACLLPSTPSMQPALPPPSQLSGSQNIPAHRDFSPPAHHPGSWRASCEDRMKGSRGSEEAPALPAWKCTKPIPRDQART